METITKLHASTQQAQGTDRQTIGLAAKHPQFRICGASQPKIVDEKLSKT